VANLLRASRTGFPGLARYIQILSADACEHFNGRAIKWHTEHRVLRNGNRTVVLR
jgi:formyltetrahydrofolate hydrolase